MRQLSVIFFTILVLIGCSTDEQTLQLIEQAESVMIEHPDSALNIIRSVDAESIRGEEDMAHYRLAMAEAMYYNRLAPSRDSIAQPLFDYYLEGDDHAKRARALYQHALVMMSEGENAKAMYSLMEAEKSLEHVDNPRLEGLMHRTKGDIYGLESLYYNALVEYQIAKEYFDRLDLPFHSAYSLYNIGKTYHNLRDFSSSIQTLCDAESLFAEIGYSSYVYDVQIELCYIYIELGDFDNMRDLYRRIDVANNVGYSYCDYFSVGAILSAHDGDFELSQAMLDKAKNEMVINSMHLLYSEFLVKMINGENADALNLYIAMISEQDKSVYNIINNSLLQSQIDLLSTKIESDQKLQAKNKTLYLLIAIIVTIVISLLTFALVYKQRKYKQKIRQYIETIADFELLKRKTNTELDSAIEALYRQSLNEINDLCEIYYEQEGSSRLASKVVEQVEKNIDRLKNDQQRIAELESAVNMSSNDIMHRLREQCPDLCERDMRIALYTYAGFSNRAISLLVGCGSDAVPKFKYSIREQIKRSQAEDESMLIEPLYNKKHLKSDS